MKPPAVPPKYRREVVRPDVPQAPATAVPGPEDHRQPRFVAGRLRWVVGIVVRLARDRLPAVRRHGVVLLLVMLAFLAGWEAVRF